MSLRRIQVIAVFIASLAAPGTANAQQFNFPAAAAKDSTVLASYMPRLATQVLAAYRDENRRIYLDNLFRLQFVAGSYADSKRSLDSLRAAQGKLVQPEIRATNILYSIVAAAMQRANSDQLDDAIRREFRAATPGLDDWTAAFLMRALSVSRGSYERGVNSALQRQGTKTSISLTDALRLIKAYQVRHAFRAMIPLSEPLIAEDDQRRYIVQTDVPVRTPDGATVCTMIVRPRTSGRLPTLLNFTIYADPKVKLVDARRAASNRYVGVIGYTRGKGCSPDTVVPYEHDGRDAAALIDWIARQPWSDGRVGMYGGSYEGFAVWAAAKHMPKALKAIMPTVAVAPGIDVPMDGNLFLNFIYPWPFYTTNVKLLDDTTYNNFARWNRLNREWYVSGRAYRDLDKIDGTPNPIFNRWISHPTYDAYWQSMIPYGKEFARIKIPVLETAGYYYGGPGAAVYYFTEHYKHDPAANHYLVIGPYDHPQGQRGVLGALGDTSYVLAGYELDPVALIDLQQLRYEWFNHIFKNAPRPALLADKVNYQVMSANTWKHAPSIEAMANRKLRFYLASERAGDGYLLAKLPTAGKGSVSLSVDLANRTDADRVLPGGGVVDTGIDTADGVKFVSERLGERTEMSGLFSGQFDIITNKKDFDVNVGLYELTSKGEYVLLSTYWTRASHASDLVHRKLLTPGKRERIDFKSVRLTSRVLKPDSRIVVLLNIIKAPSFQINYGTGKDVSDETIADAKEPLTIQWFDDSFVDIPVHK